MRHRGKSSTGTWGLNEEYKNRVEENKVIAERRKEVSLYFLHSGKYTGKKNGEKHSFIHQVTNHQLPIS